MAFLFRSKPKSDLAKPAKELVTRLWQPPVLQKVWIRTSMGFRVALTGWLRPRKTWPNCWLRWNWYYKERKVRPLFLAGISLVLGLNVSHRDWKLPGTNLAFGHIYLARRSSILSRTQYSHAPIWVAQRYPDHILLRPALQASKCLGFRASGLGPHHHPEAWSHHRAMSRLWAPGKCYAMWRCTEGSLEAWSDSSHHSVRRIEWNPARH